MSHLTPDEFDRLRRYLAEEERYAVRSATSTRQSFFAFLRQASLGAVIGKLIDVAWFGIKRLFGF